MRLCRTLAATTPLVLSRLFAGLKPAAFSITRVQLAGLVAVLAFAAGARAQSLTFTHFAGSPGGADSVDASGSDARFYSPQGVAIDGSGNVYVADTGNYTIRKITPGGAVTTLAGKTGSSGSADGTRSAARFNNPSGVAVDGSGNVYVADTGNYTIRKITPGGVVTTFAGKAGSLGSADGTGSAARFEGTQGVAVDGGGNVYVADFCEIRKITPGGVVTTLAGAPFSLGSADGTGSAARFSSPQGVAVDGGGNVYVADTLNHTIRKITPDGVVTTLAAGFGDPFGVAVDGGGNVYVADRDGTIHKITPGGVDTTLAGSPLWAGSVDGTGSKAGFSYPSGVAVDGSGNVYVADTENDAIRKITPDGVVTTFAGAMASPGSADGTASAARFFRPFGVAVDGSSNVYVADTLNHTVRRVTPGGAVTTLAGKAGSVGGANGTGSAARFHDPSGVAVDGSGNLYVADSGIYTIRKITPGGVVTTLAGMPGSYGSADGTGSAARFNYPSGVAVDGGGNLYVADSSEIRKVTPDGVVTTLAGAAGSYGSADGTGGAARFHNPSGVAVDGSGNVYVTETYNDTIRKITPGGVVTTLAGTAGSRGSADGAGSAARFSGPHGVAVDGGGNIYVADGDNNAIRRSAPVIDAAATIDAASGAIGITHVLGTAPRTAIAWEWTLIRRPPGSTAELSSTDVENPTFTPDVADLYVFRLKASTSSGARISTVSVLAYQLSRRRAATH